MDFEFPCGRVPGGNLIIHYGIECNPQILLCCDFTKRRKSFPSTRIYFCRAKMLATFSWERSLPGREEEIQYLAGRLWRFLGESQCSITEWDLIFDVVLILEKQSKKPVCIPPWFWYRFSVSISTFAYSLYFDLISIPRYACFFIFASALRHAMVSL